MEIASKGEQEENSSPEPTLGATFTMAFGVLFGIFIHTVMTSATAEFLSYGMVWALIPTLALAVFAVVLILVIHLFLRVFRRKLSLPAWLNNRNFLRLGLIAAVLGIAAGWYGTIPKARYRRNIGIAHNEVSEIRGVGFESFLARRWLFSFKVTPQGRDEIVSGLNLQMRDKWNPPGSPEEDMFFKNAEVPWLASIPRIEQAQTFDRTTDINASALAWITFAYDPESGNAWLYKGYQN